MRLPGDRAAPMIARLARLARFGGRGGCGGQTLIGAGPDQREGGATHVNLPVLAVRTRQAQMALMWAVQGRAGQSGTPERTALRRRYGAISGQGSLEMLLAHREVIDTGRFNGLKDKDISSPCGLPTPTVPPAVPPTRTPAG